MVGIMFLYLVFALLAISATVVSVRLMAEDED